MRYTKLDVLMCRDDKKGRRIPFRLRYCTLDGEVIDTDNVICTSVNHQETNRRVRLLNTADDYSGNRNAQTRTICDCLVLAVNDTKIVVS